MLNKRKAIIVDMDGTLVDVSGIRHYVKDTIKKDGNYKKRSNRDFDSFHKASLFCPAIWPTLDQVHGYWQSRYDILIVTARSTRYEKTTRDWLHKYAVAYTKLFMRQDGDYRPDREVKEDILKQILDFWDVSHAIDDNPNVIDLWHEYGITTTVVPGWEE